MRFSTMLLLAGLATGCSRHTLAGESGGTGTSASGSDSTSVGVTSGAEATETGGSGESGPNLECDGPGGVFEGGIRIETPEDVALVDGKSEITGNLEISSLPGVTDVDFLICLETIGGELNLFGLPDLKNLDGLANVSEVGTTMSISENDALEDIASMNGLMQVDNLSINNNDSLERITGLNGLRRVDYAATITDNPLLCQSEAAAICEQLDEAPERCTTTGNDDAC